MPQLRRCPQELEASVTQALMEFLADSGKRLRQHFLVSNDIWGTVSRGPSQSQSTRRTNTCLSSTTLIAARRRIRHAVHVHVRPDAI